MACHYHVREALRLADELLEIADERRDTCENDGCILLDGVIRDCAWTIRQAALRWRLAQDEAGSADSGQ